MASCLNAVIAQQLLPRVDREGMVAALEILIGTPAVRNIIREGNSAQLETVMQTGGKYGMIVMNNYLIHLYERGIISMETLLRRCTNPEYVKNRLGRIS